MRIVMYILNKKVYILFFLSIYSFWLGIKCLFVQGNRQSYEKCNVNYLFILLFMYIDLFIYKFINLRFRVNFEKI